MNPTEPRPNEWWRDFYEGPFGEMQVAGLFDDKATKEVELIEAVTGLRPGAEVLDVPCGPGRHCVELAARGYKVTGVDFNGRVLERARARAAEKGVAVELHQQDMRALTFDERFDATICFWGSFGYFDDAGERAFAEGAFRSLKAGGRFLVETHTVETLAKIFAPYGWNWWGEGTERQRVLEERHWDLDAGRVDVAWTFLGEGSERTRSSSVRVYTYRELCELLRQCGFESFAAFDTLSGEPFSIGSRRLTLVATK